MIEIPQNCQYYLDKCKDMAEEGKFVSALRNLELAAHYAQDNEDVFDCLMTKLEIFEELHADSLAVCYEVLAQADDSAEVFIRLFNNAVINHNVEQANFYLEKMNSSGDKQVLGILDNLSEEDYVPLSSSMSGFIDRLARETSGEEIKFVDGESEYARDVVSEVTEYDIPAGRAREALEKLRGLRAQDPDVKKDVSEAMIHCAVLTDDNEVIADTFRYLHGFDPDNLAVLCTGYNCATVQDDAQMKEMFLSAVEDKAKDPASLKQRDKILIAYTFNEAGRFSDALALIDTCKIEEGDVMLRRLRAAILLNTAEGISEAESVLEELALLDNVEDKAVWAYYKAYGLRYKYIGNNIYNALSLHYDKVFSTVKLGNASLKKAFSSEHMAYVYEYMAIQITERDLFTLFTQTDNARRLEKLSEAYVAHFPERALRLLYNHRVDHRIKRFVCYYLLYSLSSYEFKKLVLTNSRDRRITVENDGYVFRNDVVAEAHCDSYPDKLRSAYANAVTDCCFYDEYEDGELAAALDYVYEVTECAPLQMYSAETLYRAIMIYLHPDGKELLRVTGLSEDDKKKLNLTASKFRLHINWGSDDKKL